MKYKSTLSLLFILIGISFCSFAQSPDLTIKPIEKIAPTDTIYYLFDKTGKADANGFKMTKFDDAPSGILFEICCVSVERGGSGIVLRSPEKTKKTIIDKEKLSSIKLTSLSTLVDFIKSHVYDFGRNGLVDKYFFCVIEPKNDKLILHDVYFKGSVTVGME